jgi:GNAT superfamily N-acetyltransferase
VLEREVAGFQYLELITALLQRARLTDRRAGVFEAADLQWWWRRDQHADPTRARFWIDGDNTPIGGLVFTDWGRSWGCDVITAHEDPTWAINAIWPVALERMDMLTDAAVDVAVRDDDPITGLLLSENGFAPAGPAAVTCTLPAADRPRVGKLPPGYRLKSRAIQPRTPHHMVARNGVHVAQRLLECSLYRPEMDLYVETNDGDLAGYGLFWADPVTRVGLVEPMRTEEAHQGRGLAGHVLTTGLDLLTRHGCTQLKVTYMEDNEVSRRLYLGTGFLPAFRSQTYRRD